MIALEEAQVRPVLRLHGLRYRRSEQPRICRECPPTQRHLREQCQQRGDFIPIDRFALGHHRAQLVGHQRHQMATGQVIALAAAQALAISTDASLWLIEHLLHPRTHRAVDGIGIEATEQAAHGLVAGIVRRTRTEGPPEVGPVV